MSTPKERAEWKKNSKEIIGLEVGDIIVYLGATQDQINWGSGGDPRSLFKVGQKYKIADLEIHSSYSLIRVEGIGGYYNSVCFELKNKPKTRTEYKTVYKCKLCNEIYESGVTSNKKIVDASMLKVVHDIKLEEFLGNPVFMNEIHFCKDGSQGIGEFLGFKKETAYIIC